MFIVRFQNKNNKSYNEGETFQDEKDQKKKLTWDDIPRNIKITALQLVYPFPVRFKKADGTLAEPFSPKLSIKNFDRYFFFNEATVPLMVQGTKVISEGIPELQAKTIAGIDDKVGIVIEWRMDKFGNISVEKYSLKKLEESIKSGLFRKEIIRDGI